jgi:hypothetical protein
MNTNGEYGGDAEVAVVSSVYSLHILIIDITTCILIIDITTRILIMDITTQTFEAEDCLNNIRELENSPSRTTERSKTHRHIFIEKCNKASYKN